MFNFSFDVCLLSFLFQDKTARGLCENNACSRQLMELTMIARPVKGSVTGSFRHFVASCKV